MKSPIIIGTRGSELALWQANFTKNELEKNGIQAELKIIKTKGDATQQWNLSFDKLEGKGFFTKELEDALLANEIDLAVHSCKDLPTEFPEGLTIAAYSKRANPFDILLIKKDCLDETKVLKLKSNAVVGTSSARRKAQLLALRPDLLLKDLRGNVPTRVDKLKTSDFDAIVLAAAGLERLNIDLKEFECIELKAPLFIPAPAQGVLAFQIREMDVELKDICKLLNDNNSSEIINIERQILHDFQGGCQIPLGIYAQKSNNSFDVWVSHAISWDEIPMRLHTVFNTNDLLQQCKQLVAQFHNRKAGSVFISSDFKEEEYLIRVLKAYEYEVHSESLIEFTPVEFDKSFDANWLFFSSKNGVNYFFKALTEKINPNIKIAAINQGTAQAIHQLGYKTHFIGQGNNLPAIAKEFDSIADGNILFPQAKKSLQSIQKNIDSTKNAITLVVYENQPKKIITERNEKILVFTSPMSAEAYFSKYHTKDFQQIISIGMTTTKMLNSLNINNIITAYEPTYTSVLDEIFAIF